MLLAHNYVVSSHMIKSLAPLDASFVSELLPTTEWSRRRLTAATVAISLTSYSCMTFRCREGKQHSHSQGQWQFSANMYKMN
jgi:hypothetical protein